MLKPRPESPLSRVISSVTQSGLALPFIWGSRLNSDDTFLIIPFEDALDDFFLVDAVLLSSFMASGTRTSADAAATTVAARRDINYGDGVSTTGSRAARAGRLPASHTRS